MYVLFIDSTASCFHRRENFPGRICSQNVGCPRYGHYCVTIFDRAELHVETTKVRQEMTTGNPQQATLLEKDIEVLREKIKAEEMKKQQEKEKRDSQNKVVQVIINFIFCYDYYLRTG